MHTAEGLQNAIYAGAPQVSSPRLGEKAAQYAQEPIAVVGMACRLPGNSNSPHALWEFLMKGGIADNEPPSSRYNLKGHFDGSRRPKTMRSPGGMFIEQVDPQDFDAAFFGISRVEAIAMDPQQRQLLEVIYECFENAGVGMEAVEGSPIGCFVGSYGVDYADMQSRDPEDRAPSVTIGVGRALLSNRISHFFNMKGPSMTIDTACSGSLVGLDVACRYLQTGEINGAVCAGANLYLSPEHNLDSGAMKGASSLSGRCHTFDVKADGYIKAEGINAVFLKRLSDAIRDRDPIRAVIRGTATNSDGRTPGIASPSAEAQSTAIRAAYANAGITDLSLTSYLECHGTGTQAGDPQEVSGVSNVFSRFRQLDDPLIIGSIKSNIGHSEPAAGVSGLLKAVLITENGIIPGNPTFITPNPKIDFLNLKVKATRTSIPWPKGKIRRTSVNSFGYGGSNAHAVVEEPQILVPASSLAHKSSYTSVDNFFDDDDDALPTSARPSVLIFSANKESSLKANVQALRRHLINPKIKVELSDLAYTLSDRRTRHFNRAYLVTKDLNLDESSVYYGKKSNDPPKIGFVFTGQGAQWAQMGKELIDMFPQTKTILKHLDEVLQATSMPPSWSLLDELTQPRSPEHMRQPEFSQPLVTALQLVILSILKEWGIDDVQGVVGHSSGEIAAAKAAGLLTQEEAIVVAYYRGQSAKAFATGETQVGMLAAGVGPTQVEPYLIGLEDTVQIACYNSPSSITLSGQLESLKEVKNRLSSDSHFARLLQVDLAYHSKFMAEIGEKYREMLAKDFSTSTQPGHISMFSTVLGRKMDRPADVEYWISNLLSPVQFESGVTMMVSPDSGIDFLIEIGPSAALAGPISQIIKNVGGNAAKAQYCATLKRGQNSAVPLFEAAGKLFVSGSSVDFGEINLTTPERKPSVLVDLPNYSWDHTTKYWYENDSSKDWRNRMFPAHDLLGSKVLGTSWQAPSWRQVLRLDNLPWLRDHKMGSDIVFPGAGFIALAVEAVRQKHIALTATEEAKAIENPAYRIRDVKFPKALVLAEGEEGSKIMVSLAPTTKSQDWWQEFKVTSLVGAVWTEHCHGLVRVEEDREEIAAQSLTKPLEHPVSGQLWYKAMHDAGYNFGPHFQRQLEVESSSGKRYSRSTVSLEKLQSELLESEYPMHPISIDGCFQTCAPSLWNGHRSSVDTVLIPAVIGEMLITSSTSTTGQGISVTSAAYSKLGRIEETRNYVSEASVYDPETGKLLFRLSGFRYHKLETGDGPYDNHSWSRLVWQPDVSFLTQDGLNAFLDTAGENGRSDESDVQKILDILAHKQPSLAVLELNMIAGDDLSVWLEKSQSESIVRAACSRYALASPDANALVRLQANYDPASMHEFSVVDMATSKGPFADDDGKFDLLVVRTLAGAAGFAKIMENAQSLLRSNGNILALTQTVPYAQVEDSEVKENAPALLNETPVAKPDSETDSEDNSLARDSSSEGDTETSKSQDDSGYSSEGAHSDSSGKVDDQLNILFSHPSYGPVRQVKFHEGSLFDSLSLTHVVNESPLASTRAFSVVHFQPLQPSVVEILQQLRQKGWQISEHPASEDLSQIVTDRIVVLDELSTSVFPVMQETTWERLKDLTVLFGKRILWVTKGSQMEVKDPEKAMAFGLSRTIRAEDPSVSFTCLDVEQSTGSNTVSAIHELVTFLEKPAARTSIESEYVERGGTIFISRVHPDHLVNTAEKGRLNGAEAITRSLHESETLVRLQCERLGNLDALVYTEVAVTELPIRDNCVEVEVVAAGLNFKDVAVTMGIVPENEHLLGLEGAGLIRRMGKAVTGYHIGQRVLVFEKGTFANRIEATVERIHAIPDSMTFEQASTLASVYLTALYSIYDLGRLSKGDTVLLHSATGGLGIACIQICQHIGAEIFCTVGTDKKRQFLKDNFGIPDDHIFNSRTAAFAAEIMRVTNGYGIDLILNSLTGDLLDASWRCIAEGGNMIELGKKDMLDRKALAMEPFGRNASYRCFDMAHKHVSDKLIARLLSQLFDLLESGHVKPIDPIKTFPFEDIQSAFRYMRGANHIGKIVVSNGKDQDIWVPIRPAPRILKLRPDVSYVIVGGLRGLCGSLAVDMAQSGAKNLVIIGRSGYGDPKSQSTLKDIYSEGCKVDLIQGDVASLEDVQRAFKSASLPVGGVIQGAMVLRDTIFTSMNLSQYTQAVTPKVQGTWNLHNVALEEGLSLDFFTMLSSVSGVVGQKGQANYAAANVFLDSFASYRHGLGLAACSVDLGAIDDVGYMSEHKDILAKLETEAWTPINEALFLQIVRYSILQQVDPINPESGSQMITSVGIPQKQGSYLLADARFSSLCFGQGAEIAGVADGKNKAIQSFSLMIKAGAAKTDVASVVQAAVEILNTQFTTILRLGEPMEPAKPLSSYGLDSLAAVELRNWVRVELGVEITVLDITNAASLVSLAEKVVTKLSAEPAKL